jgi:MFS family permease
MLGDRQLRLALLVLAFANLAMVGVMAVAPVHLHAHGAGMGMIGLLVGAHIAAMYLPSPLSGWLADTLGARAVAGAGALLLVAAGGGAGLLLVTDGFGLVGLVAAAPCVLVLTVVATTVRSAARRPGPRVAAR